jgi:hypothetical protein
VTQIVSVITKEYALLVSDRRLTYGDGPKVGQVLSDDTCKLVSLCNICGIGYSGFANLGGSPTHEWIAKTLAAANCHDAGNASQIIGNSAPGALPQVPPELRRQIFIVAGWAQFDNPPGLRSHFCVVTNALDDAGRVLVLPHAQLVGEYALCAMTSRSCGIQSSPYGQSELRRWSETCVASWQETSGRKKPFGYLWMKSSSRTRLKSPPL